MNRASSSFHGVRKGILIVKGRMEIMGKLKT